MHGGVTGKEYLVIVVVLLGSLGVNLYLGLRLSRHLVPNYWRERGLAAFANAMGNLPIR